MRCVPASTASATREVAFTVSSRGSCAKEGTSLEATAPVERASMVTNLKMKHSCYLTRNQVNATSWILTLSATGVLTCKCNTYKNSSLSVMIKATDQKWKKIIKTKRICYCVVLSNITVWFLRYRDFFRFIRWRPRRVLDGLDR